MNQKESIGIRSDHVGGDGPPTWVRARWHRLANAAPILVDLLRLLRNPGLQIRLLADEWRWRRASRQLRKELAATPKTSSSGTLLIIAMSDQLWDIKWRAVVAAGVRARGWKVTVLTRNRRQPRIRRYFRSIGVDDFLSFEGFEPSANDRAEAEDQAARLLAGGMEFATVRAWRYRSVWVGPQVLSTASRRLLQGAVDPTQPTVAAEVRRVLPQMLLDAHRAEQVVNTVEPTLGLIDEYHYSVAAPLVDTFVANGTPIVTMRPMWSDDAFVPMRLTERTRRVHHASVLPETLSRGLKTRDNDRHDRELERWFIDRYGPEGRFENTIDEHARLHDQLGTTPDRPVVVVFCHVLWDANLFYGEDLFDGFGDWLIETVRAACANERADWIVKLHPANVEKSRFHGSSRQNDVELIAEHVGRLPAHVRLLAPTTDIPAPLLFKYANAGITVRGTPGLEMPCYGKPALTAGTGRYDGLGFTTDSRSREEYRQRLAAIHELPPCSPMEVERAREHAHLLFTRRSWQMTSATVHTADRPSGWSPLDRNIQLRDRAWDEGLPADLADLSAWMIGDSLDYVDDARPG